MPMEESQNMPTFKFPPGVRFHPSDEELIVYYLHNKVNSRPLPAAVVGEVQLYNHNPWDLPNMALFGEDEWYFFSPRERKYPNGARPNRTAASGYWKATGTDKPITGSSGSRIGVKKALVFYIGKPPNGVKTEWIMIEYRIPDNLVRTQKSKGSMRLDDWVLCRIRQKGNMSKNNTQDNNALSPNNNNNNKQEEEEIVLQNNNINVDFSPLNTNPPFDELCSNYFLSKDCQLLAKLLVNDQDLPQIPISSTSQSSNGFGVTASGEYASSMESQGENSYFMESFNHEINNGYENFNHQYFRNMQPVSSDRNENDFLGLLNMQIPSNNIGFYDSHDVFNDVRNLHGLDHVSQFDGRFQD